MASDDEARSEAWRGPGYRNAEAYIESNDSGMYVPVDTGEGVSYAKDSVGAGPIGEAYVDKRGGKVHTAETANGYLKDKVSGRKADLWISEFKADFSLTGTEAQSKYKKDFYPRFLAQPRYTITIQFFNQEHRNRTVKMIRQGMIRQLATGTSADDLFELRIEDRTFLNEFRRTTRGGYKGSTLRGYVETIDAGAEKFVNAPTTQFTFVLANATEGIMRSLDGIEDRERLSGYVRGKNLLSGRIATPNPDVDLPQKFGEQAPKKPKKKPTTSNTSDEEMGPPTPPAIKVGEVVGTVWGWLSSDA